MVKLKEKVSWCNMSMDDREYYRNYKKEQVKKQKGNYSTYSTNTTSKKTIIGWKWIFLSIAFSAILWYLSGSLEWPIRFLFISIPVTTITTTRKTYRG
ncbi:MAG TPA: hypothetical protein DEQ26_09090 [Flavobacteriaceae bacterium]|nr:hypothetical protein [Flavobacteriaceae bacterium]